jgi:hypothetical protein
VSLIPAHLDCRLDAENPTQFTNSSSVGNVFSGHLYLSFVNRHRGKGDSDGSSRGDTRASALPDDNRPWDLLSLGEQSRVLAHLPAGAYQLCFRTQGYPQDILHHSRAVGSGFLPTGIGVQVQDTVKGVSANYITSGHGLQAVLPGSRGNRIKILFRQFSGYTWHASDAVSVRPSTSDCSDPAQQPWFGAAGLLAVGEDGVLEADGIDDTLPGLYQLCLHFKGKSLAAQHATKDAMPSASATGISVRVQIAATSLTVNSVKAARGLRAAMPHTTGNSISLTLLRPLDLDEPRNATSCTVTNKSSSQSPSSSSCEGGCTSDARVSLKGGCANCTCTPVTSTITVLPSFSFPFLAKDRPAPQSSLNASIAASLPPPPASSSLWIWLLPPDIHCNDSIEISDTGFAAKIQASYDLAPSPVQPATPSPSPAANGLVEFGGSGGFGRASSGAINMSTQAATMLAHVDGKALDAALSTLGQGIYQICVSAEANTSTVGTGLSLTIQAQLTGLEVNGLWMGVRRDEHNIVARVPRREGNALRVFKSVLRGSVLEQVLWDSHPSIIYMYNIHTYIHTFYVHTIILCTYIHTYTHTRTHAQTHTH